MVKAWQCARSAGLDLFRPGIAQHLCVASGWPFADAGPDQVAKEERVTLLDGARALELADRAAAEGRADVRLVMTSPAGSGAMLGTKEALRSVIAAAERELLVVGYTITDPSFVDLIVDRARSGVRVTIVGDREQGASDVFIRTWPIDAGSLRALENVEPVAGVNPAIHAKAVVADRAVALLGSANFTRSGMLRNLELGVIVRGFVAAQICVEVDRLEREHWLVAAPASRS